MRKLPYSKDNDYTEEQADLRRKTVEEETGTSFHHLKQYSVDPKAVEGNIENFSGVAQVPLGFAGPLLVKGEHAQGEFYVPMATTEGTLVASYSRGMKIARLAGGITTTVVDDRMNRAPVFIFQNAKYARDFGEWVEANFETIKAEAEQTTSVGKLQAIGQYPVGKMRWLRFNYRTGDAAGQNMVTKATHRACNWILSQNPKVWKIFLWQLALTQIKNTPYSTPCKPEAKKSWQKLPSPNSLWRKSSTFLLPNSLNSGSFPQQGLSCQVP